jgi:hypothetical protein
MLVNWDVMLVQKMTRKDDGGLGDFQWVDRWYNQDEILELATIGLAIPVAEIYEKATLPPIDPIRRFRRRKV